VRMALVEPRGRLSRRDKQEEFRFMWPGASVSEDPGSVPRRRGAAHRFGGDRVLPGGDSPRRGRGLLRVATHHPRPTRLSRPRSRLRAPENLRKRGGALRRTRRGGRRGLSRRHHLPEGSLRRAGSRPRNGSADAHGDGQGSGRSPEYRRLALGHESANEAHPYGTGNPDGSFRDYIFHTPAVEAAGEGASR